MTEPTGSSPRIRSLLATVGAVLALLVAFVIALASSATEGAAYSMPIELPQAALALLIISAAILVAVAGPIMSLHPLAGGGIALAGVLLGVAPLLVCVGGSSVLLVWLLVTSPSVAAAAMALLAPRPQAS
jgi:hypothetical protein